VETIYIKSLLTKKMTASEFKKLIREEVRRVLNEEKLNEDMALVGDNTLANRYASKLTNQLFSEKIRTPLEYIMKWGEELKIDKEVNGRLSKDQIEDLKKEAIALRGIIKGNSRYKQVLKDKILKSLKGEKIR
jgi:hypothetical protein